MESAARTCLLAACLALGFGCAKGAGSVADRFVDKYYVESDQQGALPLTDGVATLRLREELKLAAEGRAPGMDLVSRQIRVYYKRTAFSDDGEVQKVDYALDIRPQGGGELRRAAHLELRRSADGSWRVVRFNETQPR
ncbi:MAG: hypothetical protein NVSMB23_11370 [Myxococcales bacterium]